MSTSFGNYVSQILSGIKENENCMVVQYDHTKDIIVDIVFGDRLIGYFQEHKAKIDGEEKTALLPQMAIENAIYFSDKQTIDGYDFKEEVGKKQQYYIDALECNFLRHTSDFLAYMNKHPVTEKYLQFWEMVHEKLGLQEQWEDTTKPELEKRKEKEL